MTKTLFYILTIARALVHIFGTQPALKKLNIRREDTHIEKVTGALIAIYFCLTAFIYVTGAQ